jgi:competence protein ComEC
MDFSLATAISPKVKLASLLLIILLTFLGLLIFGRPDGKLHINFCDVGQGDAIFLRSPQGKDILIDGGPDARVLDCISSMMPFYDRTLELVVLTHPQADHLVGLIEVLKRFKVEKIFTTGATNETAEFEAWQKAKGEEHAESFQAKKGQKIYLEKNLSGEVFWPPELFFVDEINDTSIVLKIDYFDFCLLLTGDAGKSVWFNLSSGGGLSSCFLLKVPHHGSKNGLDEILLSQTLPKVAVISVGQNNSYGHPHKEILDLLEKYNIRILRTDKNGTIEIVSDGKRWWLK